MPTSVVKEGAIWIIRGDTRPIKDVLLEAGATWQAQRVRWEFAGESLPEVIQAALDGRRVLPTVEVVPIVAAPSPVGEPDWDKLTSVLIDLRDVLRETSAPRITFYSVVVPKKVETRKKSLKALIDADAVGIAQYNTSATRWSVLWSTGMVEIMDLADLELASEERRSKLLPAVEGATVLYASKKTASQGTLRRLKPSGKWEIELEGGTLASEYDKGVIVLAHTVLEAEVIHV